MVFMKPTTLAATLLLFLIRGPAAVAILYGTMSAGGIAGKGTVFAAAP